MFSIEGFHLPLFAAAFNYSLVASLTEASWAGGTRPKVTFVIRA
jgi:hypothetical protein